MICYKSCRRDIEGSKLAQANEEAREEIEQLKKELAKEKVKKLLIW